MMMMMIKYKITTNFSQFVHSLLKLSLLFIQRGLGSIESLAFWLDNSVDPAIEFHRTDPHAQRLGGEGHAADDVWLEVRLDDVRSDLLEDTVRDVVFVEVDELFDEVWITCEHSHTHILKTLSIVTAIETEFPTWD